MFKKNAEIKWARNYVKKLLGNWDYLVAQG